MSNHLLQEMGSEDILAKRQWKWVLYVDKGAKDTHLASIRRFVSPDRFCKRSFQLPRALRGWFETFVKEYCKGNKDKSCHLQSQANGSFNALPPLCESSPSFWKCPASQALGWLVLRVVKYSCICGVNVLDVKVTGTGLTASRRKGKIDYMHGWSISLSSHRSDSE